MLLSVAIADGAASNLLEALREFALITEPRPASDRSAHDKAKRGRSSFFNHARRS
jgi:hypothetical protein